MFEVGVWHAFYNNPVVLLLMTLGMINSSLALSVTQYKKRGMENAVSHFSIPLLIFMYAVLKLR